MCQIMKNHQLTIDSMEFKKRESNLILRGIPEEDPPDKEEDKRAIERLMHKIGANHPIPEPKRLGKLNNTNRHHRAILLEYNDKKQIDDLMGKARHLADLMDDDPAKKIYIQRDLPPSIREANFKLRSQLKIEKAKQENTGANLKLDDKNGTISRSVGNEEVVIFTVQHPF